MYWILLTGYKTSLYIYLQQQEYNKYIFSFVSDATGFSQILHNNLTWFLYDVNGILWRLFYLKKYLFLFYFIEHYVLRFFFFCLYKCLSFSQNNSSFFFLRLKQIQLCGLHQSGENSHSLMLIQWDNFLKDIAFAFKYC